MHPPQPALSQDQHGPARFRCVAVCMVEVHMCDTVSAWTKLDNIVIHRCGVCTVNARGLPTVTPGLTHFVKLDGKQQQCIAGMPDSHPVNSFICLR